MDTRDEAPGTMPETNTTMAACMMKAATPAKKTMVVTDTRTRGTEVEKAGTETRMTPTLGPRQEATTTVAAPTAQRARPASLAIPSYSKVYHSAYRRTRLVPYRSEQVNPSPGNTFWSLSWKTACSGVICSALLVLTTNNGAELHIRSPASVSVRKTNWRACSCEKVFSATRLPPSSPRSTCACQPQRVRSTTGRLLLAVTDKVG